MWEFRWARDLMILAAVLLVLWLMYSARAILVPALIGLGLAYVFNPIVTWASVRFKTSRMKCTAAMMILMFIVVVSALAWLGPIVIRQVMVLTQKYPEYVDRMGRQITPALSRVREQSGGFFERIREVLDPKGHFIHESTDIHPSSTQPTTAMSDTTAPSTTEPGVSGTTIPPQAQTEPNAPSPTNFETGVDRVTSNAPATQPASTQSGGRVIPTVQIDWKTAQGVMFSSMNIGFDALGTTISLIVYSAIALVVITFCFFVFSSNLDRIVPWFGQFVPIKHREQTFRIIARMDRTIAAIIRGRLIQASIMTTVLTIGWGIVGVPYFLVLGLVCGMLNVIPYAASIGLPLAILLSWVDQSMHGGDLNVWMVLFWPAAVYFCGQLLDGWVVEPIVQGHATNLDPLSVLLSVLTGAALFGLTGMLLAIPFAACVRILGEELLVPKLKAWADHVRPSDQGLWDETGDGHQKK